MSRMRILRAPAQHYLAVVAFHLHQLQVDGRKVLLITFNRPYEQLKQALGEQGVDPDGLFFIDVTGQDHGHTLFLPDAIFVDSPNQLELVAMRTKVACQRLGGNVTVVLDSMNLVAQYNSLPSAQEFTHFLVNALRAQDVPADFLVLDTRDGEQLAEGLAAYVDGQERLQATR